MRYAALLSVLSILLATDAAFAQRPSTLGMSCAQAKGVVAARGAAVLSTGRNTFERFVASPRACLPGEYAYTAYAPTRDASRCRLGYRCDPVPPIWKDNNRFGFGGGLFHRW